mgnify:CR=1 FL=1
MTRTPYAKTTLASLAFLASATSAVADATEAAKSFFDHYRDQNVPAMIELFAPAGIVEYVPFGLQGPVAEVGPGSWGVLIDAFPDLSNDVHSITGSADGTVAFVDVNISGTQTKEVFGVPNKGQSYDLRHLFVIETNAVGQIVHVTSFWDNAYLYVQRVKSTLN